MGALAGKWVWIWNWRRCEGGDAGRIAERLIAAGCNGALVKAFDGPRWFPQSASEGDQGKPWREIAAELKSRGVPVGGWGYCYGDDPAGEAQRAIETAQYGHADLLVLDVEAEFKGKPQAAEELCRRVREALGPDYPLYFSSFALPRYHRAFPFEVFRRYCDGAAPQVYWNAFKWPVKQAVEQMYEDHTALGIAPEKVFPVGGLYAQGAVRYPLAEEVGEFARLAGAQGSNGVSFWSYEHMDDGMWSAVAAASLTAAEEEEMSSSEFEQISRSIGDLSRRMDGLEADVRTLRAGTATAPRTYTVQPGDTLSGIAAKLGIADWRRLYEANRAVIGPNPDLIRPGQVFVVG